MKLGSRQFWAVFLIQLVVLLPVSFAYIYNVQVNAGSTTASISWQTTTPADSRVDYGKTQDYGGTQSNPNEVSDHLISLQGLTSGSKYYFRVSSTDFSTSQVSSEIGSFTTKDTVPPAKVTGVRNGSITSTSLTLYWNAVSDTDIDNYIIYMNNIVIGHAGKTQSNWYVTSLASKTTYSFAIAANDTSGNVGPKSDPVSITTKDTQAPMKITGLKTGLVGNTTINLVWDRNGESDFKEYVIYRLGNEVGRTNVNSFSDKGLMPAKKYEYSVAAIDDSGNVGEKSDTLSISTTTNSAGAFAISAVYFRDGAVFWTTNDLSNSSVYYGTSVPNLFEGFDDDAKDHSVALSGLENGRRYNYYVESCREGLCARSNQATFIAGYSSETPTIEASIPSDFNMRRLNFNGTTKPQSMVQVFVNGVLRDSIPNTGNSGAFTASVLLDESTKINIIKLFARDFAGQNVTREYSVNVDTSEFVINATIPFAVPSANFVINGTVSKQANLKVYVLDITQSAPGKTTGLSANAQGNAIQLKWNAVNNTDKYMVYRTDVGLLAMTASPFYTDSRINSSKTYTYIVSAMDRLCREGERSDSIAIASASTTNLDRATQENVSCNLAPQRTLNGISGAFTASVQLKEGNNLIRIEGTDFAGGTSIFEKTVLFDTRPVQILEPTDLGAYSPSYSQTVKINGRTNKMAVVKAFINNAADPKYTVSTNADGTFTLEIDLTNYNTDRSNDTVIDYTYNDPTASRDTNVRIVAVDYLDRESNSVSGMITYAICGYGFWWNINNTQPMPDILVPSLIRSGAAQVGISYAIGWQGGNINYTFGTAAVKLRPLSPKERENWDEDWISNTQTINSYDGREGFVTVLLKGIDPFPGDTKKTEYDREKNLSDHRYSLSPVIKKSGETPFCTVVPAMGCVKVPLMMELTFYQNKTKYIQRQCWDVEVSIDRRPDPANIPKSWLKNIISTLNSTIELIDMVLKPLEKITPYVFYACLGSMAFSYIWEVVGSVYDRFTNLKSGVNPEVAREGGKVACADYYVEGGKSGCKGDKCSEQKEACDNIAESSHKRFRLQRNSQWVCDRIFSPAVPSFQKFVKDNTKAGPSGGASNIKAPDVKKAADTLINPHVCDNIADWPKGVVGASEIEKLYSYKTGSDSQAVREKDITGLDGVQLEKYCTDYKVYSGAKELSDAQSKKLCCLYSYLGQWSSGCMFMKIDKESACLGADTKNSDADQTFLKENDCKTIFSKAAGICDAKGVQQPELVNSGKAVRGTCEGFDVLKDSYAYFAVFKPTGNDDRKYTVRGGIPIENYDITLQKANDKDRNLLSNTKSITDPRSDTGLMDLYTSSKLYVFGDYTRFFEDDMLIPLEKGENAGTGAQAGDYKGVSGFHEEIKAKLGSCLSAGGKTTTITYAEARTIYNNIVAVIGAPGKEYVVDPTSGLLRSIQCVSLPALRGYLQHWRNILNQAKKCFETILGTGDGSPGVCRSFVTVYLCDMIYDLISCFMKSSGGLSNERADQGVGGVFAAMSNAGDRITKSVTERYGNTNTFNSLFSERKLVHAICTFIFTGDWVFDLNSVLESTYNMPLTSTVFIGEANRRFVNYNPIAQQGGTAGLTTYNYNIALMFVAGSDVRYNLQLCCSNDFSCRDGDFTSSGACDCSHGNSGAGPQMGFNSQLQAAGFSGGNCIDITSQVGTGALKKGQTIDKEVFFVAQNHGTRYDKAILTYSYDLQKDQVAPKETPQPTVKHISLSGGTPPNICQFDLVDLKYVCRANFNNDNWVKLENLRSQPEYRVDEKLRIEADVVNKIPANAICNTGDCESTKYLALEVKNARGNIIPIARTAVKAIDTAGRQTYILPFEFGGDYIIKASDLTTVGGGREIALIGGTAGFDAGVDSQTSVNEPAPFKFGIKFLDEKSYQICSVKEIGTIRSYQVTDLLCGGASNTLDQQSRLIRERGAVIRVGNLPAKAADTFAIFQYTPSNARCVNGEKWTATARIYLSQMNGAGSTGYAMSQQVSFYQGQMNEKQVEFTIQCPNTLGQTNVASTKLQWAGVNQVWKETGVAGVGEILIFKISFDKSKGAEVGRIDLMEYASKTDEGSAKKKTDLQIYSDGEAQGGFTVSEAGKKYYRAVFYGKETNNVLFQSDFVDIEGQTNQP